MKYRFLSLIKDFLSMVMNYVMIMCLYYGMAGACNVNLSPAISVGFIIVPAFYYLVRKYINNIVLFTFLHLFTALGLIWIFKAGVRETVVLIFLVMFLTVSSFVCRLNREEPGEKIFHPIASLFMAIAPMILLSYVHKEEYLRLIPRFSLVYITLYILHLYITKFIWFDFINRKIITNMPTKNILKAGAPYVCGLAGFYALVTVICVNESLVNRLSQYIKSKFLAFLKWLFMLMQSEGEEEIAEEITENTPPDLLDMTGVFEEPAEPSAFWQLLEKIFMYVAIVVAVTAVVYVIGLIIYSIVKRFKGIDTSESVELTEDYVEEREKVSTGTKEKASRKHLFKTPSEKVRALYVKIVLKNSALTSVPEKLTAREFAGLFEEDKKESALSFAHIYEKARYSPKMVTKQDALDAKMFAAKLI